MEPLVNLGRAIARLRHLYGLSRAECAGRLGVAVERLVAMESGTIEPLDLDSVARLYELDEDGLREGTIKPVAGLEGSTVFLLQGDYQDFDARALDALDRAMRAARAMAAHDATSEEGRERLRQRLQFVPTAPAGPKPADAAQQGHKLARMVRARLNLGDGPIEDMRALLEDRLGIAVLVDDLAGRDLRAASVLDVHRAAAAAVIASGHRYVSENRMLARVYLAHELCHVLFDPGSPGSVRLALDGSLDAGGSAEAGTRKVSLMESRAKGFAAELLIPLAGVNALLGAPATPEASLQAARKMVARTRDHFGTPWEVATYHLKNLGFIQPDLDLLKEEQRVPASWPPTLSRPLERMVARETSEILATASGDAATLQDTPPYVGEARQAANTALDALNAQVITAATEAIERERPIQAVHLLMKHFDDLFHAGEFEAAASALRRLDPHRFPRRVLVGVLTVTKHAREQLRGAHGEFVARVQSALADTWRLPAEDIKRIIRRLA
jgi:transcriptional regulator with XRE-family HTH domain/Zn-dependent peptidase ImmA (M78 family)